MAQTSYNINQIAGIPGLKADSRFDLVVSRIAAGTIQFGYAYKYSATVTNDGMLDGIQVVVPTASTDKVDGVALFTHNEDGQYVVKDVVNGLRRGSCWVVIDATATLNNIFYGVSAYIVAGGKFTDLEEPGNCVGKFMSAPIAYNSTTNIALLEIDLEGCHSNYIVVENPVT